MNNYDKADSFNFFCNSTTFSKNNDQSLQKISEQYFIDLQHPFDKSFHSNLIQLIKKNSKVKKQILDYFPCLLRSKHNFLQFLVQQLINIPQFHKIISQFILEIVTLKQSNPSLDFQIFIITNIWQPLLKTTWSKNKNINNVITYLCMKMRSLDSPIRKASLLSFINLYFQYIIQKKSNNQQIDSIKKSIPLMIEKQVLLKKVSYIKGIFLQLLQDQLHEIRVMCLQCLGMVKQNLNLIDLKPIILYMVNDQHQLVRQKALQIIIKIDEIRINEQDVLTLITCLKQNNLKMRNLVYQTLSHSIIQDQKALLLLIDQLLRVLIVRKNDKKKIYQTFGILGRKYNQIISKIAIQLLQSKIKQPNLKNLQNKALIILISNTPKSQWSASLPSYFRKHYLYVKDVQQYAFKPDNSKTNFQHPNNLMKNELQQEQKGQYQNNIYKIYQLCICEIQIQNGLKLDFLQILKQILEYFMQIFSIMDNNINIISFYNDIKKKFNKLRVQYQIQKDSQWLNLMNKILEIIKIKDFNEQNNANKIQRKRQEQILQDIMMSLIKIDDSNIKRNILKISKHDSKMIIVSNCQYFLQRCYIGVRRDIRNVKIKDYSYNINTNNTNSNILSYDYLIKLTRIEPIQYNKDQQIRKYNLSDITGVLQCIIQNDIQ